MSILAPPMTPCWDTPRVLDTPARSASFPPGDARARRPPNALRAAGRGGSCARRGTRRPRAGPAYAGSPRGRTGNAAARQASGRLAAGRRPRRPALTCRQVGREGVGDPLLHGDVIRDAAKFERLMAPLRAPGRALHVV